MRFRRGVFSAVRQSAVFVFASLALLGCNKHDGNATASNSQIVARIGDQVVSAQELDTELRWNNVAADRKRDDAVVKQVLGELVARKYLVQQALAAKLDREPTVLLDLLRSREQVLARALVQRELSRQASAISIADTEKYILDHPLKFADRKMLSVDQVSFPLASIDQTGVDAIKELGSIEKIDQRLTEQGIAHSRSAAAFSTSELPDDLLRSMQDKKQGELIFVKSGQNGLFLSVKGEEPHPLKGDAAMVVARQLQQQDLARAQASLTNFTASMEAKYDGDYARIMGENPGPPTN